MELPRSQLAQPPRPKAKVLEFSAAHRRLPVVGQELAALVVSSDGTRKVVPLHKLGATLSGVRDADRTRVQIVEGKDKGGDRLSQPERALIDETIIPFGLRGTTDRIDGRADLKAESGALQEGLDQSSSRSLLRRVAERYPRLAQAIEERPTLYKRVVPAAGVMALAGAGLGFGAVTGILAGGVLGFYGREFIREAKYTVRLLGETFIKPTGAEVAVGAANKYLLGLLPTIGVWATTFLVGAQSPMLFVAASLTSLALDTYWGPFLTSWLRFVDRADRERGPKWLGGLFLWNSWQWGAVFREYASLANPAIPGPLTLKYLGDSGLSIFGGAVFDPCAAVGINGLKGKGVLSRTGAAALGQFNDLIGIVAKGTALGAGIMPLFYAAVATEAAYKPTLLAASRFADQRPIVVIGRRNMVENAKVQGELGTTPLASMGDLELELHPMRDVVGRMSAPFQVVGRGINALSGGYIGRAVLAVRPWFADAFGAARSGIRRLSRSSEQQDQEQYVGLPVVALRKSAAATP